jgi:predicted RNase H-like HicB family nuclease
MVEELVSLVVPESWRQRLVDGIEQVTDAVAGRLSPRRRPSHVSFHVVVERDELDGGYVAECLNLPGCVSQGETEDEALENLADAIIEVLRVRMRPTPVREHNDDNRRHELALSV